jgi:Rrf2 family protein
MLRLTKKYLCAVEAVLDIAYNGGSQPVQSKGIAERQGIPKRYLEQVLQQLVHKGILTGVRGPRGGYLLARERRRITVGEIVRVVAAADAGNGVEDPPESDLGAKVVWPVWGEAEEERMHRLDQVTIEALCHSANAAGIESESARRLDFII